MKHDDTSYQIVSCSNGLMIGISVGSEEQNIYDTNNMKKKKKVNVIRELKKSKKNSKT